MKDTAVQNLTEYTPCISLGRPTERPMNLGTPLKSMRMSFRMKEAS
jgi:hypothetical protein